MKKLLILSGKGGTGKTTTAASFIRFSEAKAFADCDVDAPNLHIVSKINTEPSVRDYYGIDKAEIDPAKCLNCGKCASLCRFGAIKNLDGHFEIDEFGCEGCGVCVEVCPAKAISLKADAAGKLALYKASETFATAELKMGRGNSGKLVSEVKSLMTDAAPDAALAIIDGSPGIGCPVIASVTGVDLALIVTEPSASGLSDLKRLLHTSDILRVKVAVCINKYDACPQKAQEIKEFCEKENIAFVGFLPFDKKASHAINHGLSVADIDCPLRDALRQVYEKTMALLEVKL